MLPAPEIGRFLECANRAVKHGKVAGGNSTQVKPHDSEENSRVEHNPPRMDPVVHQRLPVEEQFRRLASFFETMSARRTIRAFSPEPVPFELIETAIKTAATAPSGANQQPWRFVVVSSPEVKRQIREAAESEEKEFYERRAPREWLAALAPLGTDWRKVFLETAPYLVVIFRVDYGLKLDAAGVEVKTKHYYASESVGIAAGMLLAAFQVAGLATVTHTPSPMGFLSKILNRPKNEKPYLLIPVGYPADDATVPRITKKSMGEILQVVA
jgi:iodotyrosine deiodinase